MKKLSLILSTLLILNAQLYADTFPERDGKEIYLALCASCHMPDGKGAIGAGQYPGFINNKQIVNKAYTQLIVLYGLNGMPALGGVLDDEQIANVINYIRKDLGGYADDGVAPKAITELRVLNYEYNDLN